MTENELIRVANDTGIKFMDFFSAEDGIEVGTIFHVGNATWVIGRIDKVVVQSNLLLVEGLCIREEEYNGEEYYDDDCDED